MPKTNWQDPGSTEILSTHISGLQEAVGKIEDAIGVKTVAETNVTLTEVYISDTDRYRIYQAPAGKRNWVASPAPVIKKNGVQITTGFTIDYGGGAIILSPAASSSDTFTADVTYTVKSLSPEYSTEASYEGGIFSFDASTAENSPLSATVKGRTARNDVSGNFETDTAGWTANKGTIQVTTSKYVIGTKSLEYTITILDSSANIMATTANIKAKKSKYYISFWLYPKYSNYVTARFYNITLAEYVLIEFTSITANAWNKLSCVLDLTNKSSWDFVNHDIRFAIYCPTNTNYVIGDKVYFDGIMAIDLTATFGAGNEPDLATCDKIFANYFDGTKPTLGGVVRRVGKNKANPNGFNFSINPLTGMRVGNNHEVDYTISKTFIPAGEKAVNSVNGVKFPTNVYLYAENGNYLGNAALDNTFVDELASQSYNRICYILVPKYKDYGNNVWIADNVGLPSLMVYIPKFKISDVITGGSNSVHPAFIVNGTEVPGIYISKYQNVVVNDRAYSLPYKDPKIYVTFDQALLYCYNKGNGWHLISNAEWSAVALWCKKNGFMPRGNNSYGKDYSATYERGVVTYRYESGGNWYNGRVATGSGPVSWAHDNTNEGIFDMNGNIWEWVSGLRLNGGEIQIIENNNAAILNTDHTAGSAAWRAILEDGTLVAPGSDNTLKIDNTTAGDSGTTEHDVGGDIRINKIIENQMYVPGGQYNYGYSTTAFEVITAASGVSIPVLLKALGLFPLDSSHGGDGFWARNYGERLPRRGGNWNNGSDAGVFALNMDNARSDSHNFIGFRCAYVAGI